MTYTFEKEIKIGGYVRFEYESKAKEARDSMGSDLAKQMDRI